METKSFMGGEILVASVGRNYLAFFKGKEGHCETGSTVIEAVGRLVTGYRGDDAAPTKQFEYHYVLPDGDRVRTDVVSEYDGCVSLPSIPRPGEIISLPNNSLYAVSVVRDYPGSDDDVPVIFLRGIAAT